MKKTGFILFALIIFAGFQSNIYAKKITRPTQRAVYHNNRGVRFLDAGNLKLAELEFKTAVELSPDYIEAYNNLGIVSKRQGDLRSAKIYFEKAIELDKNYAAAYSHLSMVYLDMGDLNNALSTGKKAVRKGSTMPITHFNLGLVYLAKNAQKPDSKYDDLAENEFKVATELDPHMYEAHLALARLYDRQNKYELSAIRYRLALENRPNNPAIWKELARVYNKTGDSAKAENALKKAAELSGAPAEPQTKSMQDATQLISQKKYSEAIAALKKIIQKEKKNEWAYYRLGSAYLYLGETQLAQNKGSSANANFKAAIKHLEKALEINSQLADASYNLGYTHFRMNNEKSAVEQWNKTLSINPNHARTLYNLGIYYNQKNQKEKANAYLCKFALVAGKGFTAQVKNALNIVKTNGGKCQN